jgi:hypothetical protein
MENRQFSIDYVELTFHNSKFLIALVHRVETVDLITQ